MRAFRLGLAALAFGAVLSACGGKSGALAPLNTTPAEAEAYVAKLATGTFKGKATAAADIAAVRDALPKEVSLTWGALNFDAATGAAVLTGVKITPADMPNLGVSIDEVRLWDFDADFATARLSGQRLTETASLARRIEAKNIAVFGLETLMEPMTEASTSISGAITEPLIDPLAAGDPALAAQLRAEMAAQVSFDNYEISVASFILDDVMLRPFEVKPVQLAPENEFATVMPFLQTYAASWRTFAFDTMAAKTLTGKLALTQMGQKITASFGADSYGARGARGGDIDVAFLRGLKFDMSMPNPVDSAAAPIPLSAGVDFYSLEGTRFDKLYGYLARGEWPPRTDTDLMSYGRLQLTNAHFAMNSRNLISVGEAVADLRDFHWFIPAKLRVSANDIVFDVDAISALGTEVATAGLSPEEAAGVQTTVMMDPVREILAKYGLSKPSFDIVFGWDWNPASGAAIIDGAFGLDNFLRLDAKFSGTLPGFKGVSDLIPGGFETADGEAISQLFGNASNLKMVEMNILDEGGLEKGFALAVEIGKMIPVEPGQVDFFANQSPESLRQTAVAGIYLLRDTMAGQVPGLGELIAPFGAFVEKGGKVHAAYKPAKPLDSGLLEQISVGMIAPADLLKDIKVQHTPPAGGPVKPN